MFIPRATRDPVLAIRNARKSRENEVEWTRKVEIRKGEKRILALGEACMAIL